VVEIGEIAEIGDLAGNGATGQHDEIEERVRRLVEAQVQQRIPSNDVDLFVAGAVDSLSLVEILMRLEEEFDTQIRLDELELADFRSVAAIARFLARSGIGR
jgi:acyl carrier protein